jgi:hypothetical protein
MDKFDDALGQKQPPSQERIMNADTIAVGQKQPPSQERIMNADAIAVGQKQPPSQEKDTHLSAKKVAATNHQQQQAKIQQFLKEQPPVGLVERNVDNEQYKQILRLKSTGSAKIFPFDQETFKELKDDLQSQLHKQTKNVDKPVKLYSLKSLTTEPY